MARQAPAALPLAAALLQEAASTCQRLPQALALLEQHYTQAPSLDLLDALVALDSANASPGSAGAVQEVGDEPSMLH